MFINESGHLQADASDVAQQQYYKWQFDNLQMQINALVEEIRRIKEHPVLSNSAHFIEPADKEGL